MDNWQNLKNDLTYEGIKRLSAQGIRDVGI
jgi:hypothetical protein